MAQYIDTGAAGTRPVATVTTRTSPAYQAYQILHFGFTLAPILFGLDKFFNLMVQWHQYIAPMITDTLRVDPQTFSKGAGVAEILAGLIVLFKPRIGAYIVALWLLGVIANLFLIPGFYDIALRDFGLLLGALALGRLAAEFDRP